VWGKKEDSTSGPNFAKKLTHFFTFFQSYIWPWLFGRKQKSNTEVAIDKLQAVVSSTVNELKTQVEKVHNDLEKVVDLQTEQQATLKVIGDVKSEVALVKGILLSR